MFSRARRNRRKSPRRELPKLPHLSFDWRPLATLAAGAVVATLALALGRNLLALPIRSIDIEGSFQRVSKLEIAAASGALGESFLSLDLDAVRERIQALPWVDTVTLQRVWPDTLKIGYTEYLAAARWGETGLLNTSGELFAEDPQHEYRELPRLDGPEGSHRRVAERYLEIRDRLTRLGLTLESLTMDSRGAFTIELAGGLTVRIGRDDVDGRIRRFFDLAFPALVQEGSFDRAGYVDMRYPNGFAVGWRKSATPDAQLARLDTSG
jgi:cell division protein FtsQ